MSGHSKWAQIKRKKAVTDAKKGKLFSRLAREIQLAAQNDPVPETNPALRVAIGEAKAANMPSANIERAVKKGGGGDRAAQTLEEIFYEAYGPGGGALLIKSVTDNKKRTVSELKHLLSLHGASLAEAGSVRWQFRERAVFSLDKSGAAEEKLEELALEIGAEDLSDAGERWELIAEPERFGATRDALYKRGLNPQAARIEWRAVTPLNLSAADQKNLAELVEALEEQEDVQEVFASVQPPTK